MVDRINDIAWQAHQGSVAAIIQLLNEKLAQSGVRTRAIFADGILQLLCEAARVEQLEQSGLVERIQQILETIAPRNIRRVNINSRIVREQQLLWLTEIYRDSDNQLLWSEEITLVQPNILKQLIEDLAEAKVESGQPNFPRAKSSRLALLTKKDKYKNSPTKIVAGLCSLLLLSWFVYAQLGDKLKTFVQPNISKVLTLRSTKEPTLETLPRDVNDSLDTTSNEPFGAAVRIANQASASGKIATSSTQWLELAARWQRASELMGTVPPSHSRYEEAKIRTQLYKKYSEAAQKEADKSKS
jgi:hypothetical protein